MRALITAESHWTRAVILGALMFCAPAAVHAQSVNLAWDASADTRVVGYTLHVGINPGVYGSQFDISGRSTTTFTFTGLVPGTLYYFAVSAYTAENVSSALSNVVTYKINVGPTLAQPANQTSVVGTAASLQLSATDDGDPLTFTATGLPPGLSINASTGRISGTPTAGGSYTITARVSDGALFAERTFGWAVGALSADSVAPNTGSAFTRAFALQYTNALGVSGLTSTEVRFNATTGTTANGCWVSYNPSNSSVSLRNDAGTAWVAGTLGTGSVQNGQCTVALSGSSATVSGNTLTLNLSMSFKPAYSGSKNVYLFASTAGGNTGWIDRGDWSVPTLPGPLSELMAAHLEDVNGDGRSDLLIQGSDNTFWLSLRTATEYASMTSALRHGGPYNPEGVHRADFDGDGQTDVLWQGYDNSFWLSRSTGSAFAAPTLVLQHGGPFNPDGVHIADVNADGRADVLWQGFDNSFWLSLSTGTGFSAPTHVLQHGGPFNPLGVHIADLNGDDRADMYWQGVDNGFWVSLSTGTGLTLPSRWLQHGGAFNPDGVHIADVDGDNRDDMLWQGFDNSFWLSRSTGSSMTAPTRVLQHGGPFNPFGAHVADVDGDGDADLLMQGGDNRFWLSLWTGTTYTVPTRAM